MVSTSTRLTPRERVAARKLRWVGPLTIVVGALANLVVRTLAARFFGVAVSFVYLQPSVVIVTTVVFLLLALLAFVLVGRVSGHPVRVFRIVAGVALLVSFLNPLLLLSGWWLPAPGMNLPIFWTMIVMHIVSALIAVSLLTTLAVERAPTRRDRNAPDVLLAHENQEKRTFQPSRYRDYEETCHEGDARHARYFVPGVSSRRTGPNQWLRRWRHQGLRQQQSPRLQR